MDHQGLGIFPSPSVSHPRPKTKVFKTRDRRRSPKRELAVPKFPPVELDKTLPSCPGYQVGATHCRPSGGLGRSGVKGVDILPVFLSVSASFGGAPPPDASHIASHTDLSEGSGADVRNSNSRRGPAGPNRA